MFPPILGIWQMCFRPCWCHGEHGGGKDPQKTSTIAPDGDGSAVPPAPPPKEKPARVDTATVGTMHPLHHKNVTKARSVEHQTAQQVGPSKRRSSSILNPSRSARRTVSLGNNGKPKEEADKEENPSGLGWLLKFGLAPFVVDNRRTIVWCFWIGSYRARVPHSSPVFGTGTAGSPLLNPTWLVVLVYSTASTVLPDALAARVRCMAFRRRVLLVPVFLRRTCVIAAIDRAGRQ